MPPLAYDAIDDELEILYRHMVAKKMGVLAHFLSFMEFVTPIGAHNMLALMLDLRFKGLKCVIDFLGHDKVELLVEYHKKILIPLLVKCNRFLNPDVASTYTSTTNGPSNSLFDIPILGAKANERLFLTKLCIFHQCAVNLNDDARSSLFYWKEHAKLYPDVAFLVRQILAIHGSQK